MACDRLVLYWTAFACVCLRIQFTSFVASMFAHRVMMAWMGMGYGKPVGYGLGLGIGTGRLGMIHTRFSAALCRFNIDECILFTPHTLSGPRLSFQATNETFSRHATSYRTRRRLRRVQLSLSLSFLLTYRSNEPQRPPHRKLKQDFYGCYTWRARVLGR